MFNHSAFEAVCVTTYAEDYLDYVENFPNVVQPCISSIRLLDAQYFDILKKLKETQLEVRREKNPENRKKLCQKIKILLAQGQWNGDEKLQELAKITELVDAKISNLDNDAKNFEPQKPAIIKLHRSMSMGVQEQRSGESSADITRMNQSFPVLVVDECSSRSERLGTPSECASRHSEEPQQQRHSSAIKRSRRDDADHVVPVVKKEKSVSSIMSNSSQGSSVASTNGVCSASGSGSQILGPKKRKRRKKEKSAALGVACDIPADPDEPTYCLCEQVSYGEMIGCDNYQCEIEWYHFSCVGLVSKPKGKWYCPACRGDKPNIMKSSLSSK